MIRLVLCTPDPVPGVNTVYDWLQKHCGQFPNVTIKHSPALEEDCYGIVNFGNSFGFLDEDTNKRFPLAQTQVQTLIRERFLGEMLVGQAGVVNTRQGPQLILAPIMRVPMRLPADTINPYLALKAAILAVWQVAQADVTIAIPAIPDMDPELCARQFRRAIEDRLFVPSGFPKTLEDASAVHQRLYSDGLTDLTK